jgi:hypothetical protein
MIKKITGGDLIRTEVKYKMAEASKQNLFLIVSMNYQANSGDTTNFVAMQRRSIKIPLFNFVQSKERVDNFSETLPVEEKSSIVEYFLQNTDKFKEVFHRFNQYNVDHILLKNKETNYYHLMDPIFAFLSLKCSFGNSKQTTTFYEFYAEYIKYHFFEYDKLITIDNYSEFIKCLVEVKKNPFNTDIFNNLTKVVSSLATNLEQLDPLLHLPFLSQNSFMSFFAIVESRLPFLIQEIDLNSVKLVPVFGSYESENKTILVRLISVQGIEFLQTTKKRGKKGLIILPTTKEHLVDHPKNVETDDTDKNDNEGQIMGNLDDLFEEGVNDPAEKDTCELLEFNSG